MALKSLSELIKKTLELKTGTHVYMLRHGQSMGDHTGSLVGWTDSRLSIKGRQQSNKLYRAFYPHIDAFTSIHTSDLSRCKQTLNLSLGFPSLNFIQSQQLRELNFGSDQGVHYDSLPEEDKKVLSSMEYKAPNGQSWGQVRERALKYFSQLGEGHHLISTHGGLMCALTYSLGIKQVYPNGSVISAEINKDKKDLGKIHFAWKFQDQI